MRSTGIKENNMECGFPKEMHDLRCIAVQLNRLFSTRWVCLCRAIVRRYCNLRITEEVKSGIYNEELWHILMCWSYFGWNRMMECPYTFADTTIQTTVLIAAFRIRMLTTSEIVLLYVSVRPLNKTCIINLSYCNALKRFWLKSAKRM